MRVVAGRVVPDRRYIYVIGWRKGGPIKIGVTNSPIERLGGLQSGMPWRLRIFTAVRVSNAEALEVACHACLAPRALLGEWFNMGVREARLVLHNMAARHDPEWTIWRASASHIKARQATLAGERAGGEQRRGAVAIAEREWQQSEWAGRRDEAISGRGRI